MSLEAVKPITVMVVASDLKTRELFPKVILRDRLLMTDDLVEVISLTESHPPDLAFVEIGIGDGAGLAMVHHLKALAPAAAVYALASRTALEAAANAVALGGAGLIMLPVGGDEILSAIEAVKAKRTDQELRADLEGRAAAYASAAGWVARVVALADCTSRTAAAGQLLEILVEATGAGGAAVYLSAGDRTSELVRAAVSSQFESGPPVGMEPEILDYAAREGLVALPLALRNHKVGQVLLAERPDAPGRHLDGLRPLLASQAAVSLALLGERERAAGGAIKDPASSAYSFAYYVDVAGREIDKARRYGRRFAVATVAFESGSGEAPPLSHAEMADQLLKAARDTDVLAHVDEHEFHLLMPETDGIGAHAARRRVFARLSERIGPAIPPGLLVGVSTFPHDGPDLSQLLRVARRRAEATRSSLVRRLALERTGLIDLLEALDWDTTSPLPADLSAPRAIEMAISDAAALAAAVVADGLRGGATILTVAHHDKLSLGAAVRAALGSPRDNVTLHTVDVRSTPQGEDLEALAVSAEHGAYALIGRSQGGMLRGFHAADPLLADLLAERLGRAAGLRLFTS